MKNQQIAVTRFKKCTTVTLMMKIYAFSRRAIGLQVTAGYLGMQFTVTTASHGNIKQVHLN